MHSTQVLEGAEEFELGDGPIGALLIHGFQGSPQGLRGLGERLAAEGMAVAAPRLPGHGLPWQELAPRKASEWLQEVERSFATLSEGRDGVFVVGLSFGASFALHLAATRPEKVRGVVSLAGWVYTNDPLRLVAPIASKLIKTLPPKTNDIADPDGFEIATDRFPAAAGYEAYKFACKQVRSELPKVTAPILLMHGRQDHTVPPRSSQIIHDEVSSTDKELIFLERSYHVITLDYERDLVFDKTSEFIRKRSALAQ